jgi:hypothetical protein
MCGRRKSATVDKDALDFFIVDRLRCGVSRTVALVLILPAS